MRPGWPRSSRTFPTLITASLQQGPSSHFRLKDRWDCKINSWNFLSKNYLVLRLKVIKSHHKKRRNFKQIWILGTKMFLFLNFGQSRPLYCYFCLFYFHVQLVDSILPMLGFELQITGVCLDHLTATNTYLLLCLLWPVQLGAHPVLFLTVNGHQKTVA